MDEIREEFIFLFPSPARIMHETPQRDRGDGRAAGQPKGLGREAYFVQCVARYETQGRPEGRLDPRSQQAVRA